MNYNIIATGSKGNCIVVDRCISLDMGVSAKQLGPRAYELQLVFVSHAHGDHLNPSTVRSIHQRRPGVRFCAGPEVAPHLIAAGVHERVVDVLYPDYWYRYGNYELCTVPLVHDVPNYGLKLRCNGERLFYAVDTATLDGVKARNYDLYLIEGNYGEEEIQQRIEAKQAAGEFVYETNAMRRHLSREQAMSWLAENGPMSQYELIHGHVEA